MPFKRRYYGRRYGNKDKYSVEQAAGAITTSSGNGAAIIVPGADLQGMRKVKHITISLATGGEGASGTVYWAIVYVPNGTTPQTLNLTGTSLYEPNQFVMNAGVWDPEAGPNRIGSPVSRNLNSGDAIYLILKQYTSGSNLTYQYVARYAVTLQ